MLYSWLWVAGLPVPARSLQRQRMMNRNIYLTERPDEHIVWYHDRLFLKPLPHYLLCYDFWVSHLCANASIHRSACGLLLSYAWLVEYRSDFELAKQSSLLPDSVEWKPWVDFIKDFLSHLNLDTLEQVDRRYHYGELRLSRLNLLTRYLIPSLWSKKNFFFGFTSTSTWYTAFFQQKFAWIAAAFVYVSLLLSALQVGLATQTLQRSRAFQNMSYGLTLASVVGVFAGVAVLLFVLALLFGYHLMSTISFARRVRKIRESKVDTAA